MTQRSILFILHCNIQLDVSPPNSSFGGYWPRHPASAFFLLLATPYNPSYSHKFIVRSGYKGKPKEPKKKLDALQQYSLHCITTSNRMFLLQTPPLVVIGRGALPRLFFDFYQLSKPGRRGYGAAIYYYLMTQQSKFLNSLLTHRNIHLILHCSIQVI